MYNRKTLQTFSLFRVDHTWKVLSITWALLWKKPGRLSAPKVLLEQIEAAGWLTSEVLVDREDEQGQ